MQTDHHMARMLPSFLHVIGVDPGPVPGFVVLDYTDGLLTSSDVVQCTAAVAPSIFGGIVEDLAEERTVVGLERFVVRGRSGRSSTSKAGEQTRDLIGRLVQVAGSHIDPVDWHSRAAGEVKPWATDERLEAAGLLDLTKGMRHARDAARHALFTAVRDGGVPDPLSKHAHEVVGA
jgi:hypothetical protein